MKQAIIIMGMGEMGGVFARGFLRAGHPIIPATRHTPMAELVTEFPEPLLVLVAVAEADLHPALDQLPAAWRDRLCLLQNELLPRVWQAHGLSNPTVISVWFEKKKGQDFKVIVPSPIYGPHADIIITGLATLEIPCQKLPNNAHLLFELVRKNVYILTTNIAGLLTGGTVASLWHDHRELATHIANDVMDIQDWLTGQSTDRNALLDAMVVAFEGDPDHKCMGRSAAARLQNAIRMADEAGLAVPALRDVNKKIQNNAQ